MVKTIPSGMIFFNPSRIAFIEKQIISACKESQLIPYPENYSSQNATQNPHIMQKKVVTIPNRRENTLLQCNYYDYLMLKGKAHLTFPALE